MTIGDNELPSSSSSVTLGGTAIQITAGDSFACALLKGGNVRCWGRNDDGQLGLRGSENIGDNETPFFQGVRALGSNGLYNLFKGAFHLCSFK